MKEIHGEAVKFVLGKKDYHILFVNSPMCGTCIVARKMLVGIEELLDRELFYELNALVNPTFMQQFQVESVPCLLIVKDGHVHEKIYAFRSMTYLMSVLAKYKDIA